MAQDADARLLIEAARRLVDMVLASAQSKQAVAITDLINGLDSLAVLAVRSNGGEPAELPIEPVENPRDYQTWRDAALCVLPGLGLYHAPADPRDVGSNEPKVVGDAIDDLADICIELHEGVRLAESIGDVGAASHLRWTFRAHWGKHLRELQWLLHSVLTSAD